MQAVEHGSEPMLFFSSFFSSSTEKLSACLGKIKFNDFITILDEIPVTSGQSMGLDSSGSFNTTMTRSIRTMAIDEP